MNERPWGVFHRHFPTLKPPLAVSPDVVAVVRRAIAGHEAHGLLLGVTPALTDVCAHTTAMDWSGSMIARVWPGDSSVRRAIETDWRTMPTEGPTFTVAIGDGSFNCLTYPDDYARVFAELARVLVPGGRFAVRFFTTPDTGETFADIRGSALGGKIHAIDALKWRLGIAVAATSGDVNVPRGAIHAAFEEAFPDREALLAATGWQANDLTAIDWYKGVTDTISFPTEWQILSAAPAAFENPRFLSSGRYELAERCPVLVMDLAR